MAYTLTIDNDFRSISLPMGFVFGVENDKDVQILRFQLPRFYNDIDLSEFALKVNFVNACGTGDIFLVEDKTVDEENISFTWTVSEKAYRYKGKVFFAVQAVSVDEDGNILKSFNTAPASAYVLDGLSVDTLLEDADASDILAQMLDILAQVEEDARNAAASRSTATAKASEADEYASRAESSAYNAGLAKERAQASATSASESRSTATNKASEAASSASAAAQSRSDSAQSRSDAADSRTEAAAYITELAGEKLNGDTVSYTAEAALPIEELTIDIQGSQDLNGYRSPWVGGAGKNLFKVTNQSTTLNGVSIEIADDGTIELSGTSTRIITFVLGYITPQADTSYVVSGSPFPTNACRLQFQEGSTTVGNQFDNVELSVSGLNAVQHRLRLYIANNTNVDGVVLKPMIRKAGTSDTFEPYENIAPITAYTGRTITQQGKNLFNGTFSNSTANLLLSTAFSLKAGTYTISLKCDKVMQSFALKNGATQTSTIILERYNTKTITVTLDRDYAELCVTLYNNTGLTPSVITEFQIEEGDTATEYEPYQHAETAVSWETEAGEVYKGTLNINTGVLTVTHVSMAISSAIGWLKSSAFPGGFYYPTSTNAYLPFKKNTPLSACTHRKIANILTEYEVGTVYVDGSVNIRIMSAAATVQDWKDYIDAQATQGTPITIAGELATPQTYQLTPQEVRNLIGRQTLSSNTGAIINALIRTGEETYIDKVNKAQSEAIEELQTAVDTLQTPIIINNPFELVSGAPRTLYNVDNQLIIVGKVVYWKIRFTATANITGSTKIARFKEEYQKYLPINYNDSYGGGLAGNGVIGTVHQTWTNATSGVLFINNTWEIGVSGGPVSGAGYIGSGTYIIE